MNFTYRIKWSQTGISYYGVRYKDGIDTSSLMTTYFTSSKYVHAYIEQHGLPDIVEIRKIFESKLEAKQWEERVIDRAKLYKNINWLNVGNNGSFKNVIMDSEMKRKISDAKLRNKSLKKKTYNNGIETRLFSEFDEIPEGFILGRFITEKIAAHIDKLRFIYENKTPECRKLIGEKISKKTKGKRKPDGFGEKISTANIGKPRPSMIGDLNPSKREDVRYKISKSWENRENIVWFYHKETLQSRWVYVNDIDTLDNSVWVRGKPTNGSWFNDGISNIWVRNDDFRDVENLNKGKIKIRTRKWITDGEFNKMIGISEEIPNGFHLGKTQHIEKIKYYNDGVTNITLRENDIIPDGFVKGKKKRNK